MLAELERLTAGIDQALDRLAGAFPGRTLTVVSALAEGADRLVASRALARPDAALVAVLPLPRREYVSDFPSPASKAEFHGLLALATDVVEPADTRPRDEAYEQAGRAALDRSDAVIAIWDGQTSQGRGGTAEIVAEARARGLPLAWVHAGNRKPGTMEPTSLGPEQGLVTYERIA